MYHEHPLRILKYSAKNIWLLIFPFIRGLRTYHFSKDFFYAWIQGAWKDILVICVIILFGFIRWFFSRIEVNDDMLIHHDGVFIKLDTFIPFDNISCATVESPVHLAIFGAKRLSCDTRAGIFKAVDIRLLVDAGVCNEVMKHIPDVIEKNRSTALKRPSALSILLFSVFFSSGFSGTVYVAMFFFKGGDIAHDIISVSLSTLTRETAKLTDKLLLKIPSFALMIGVFFIGSWFVSFVVNLLRYARFRIDTDNKCLKISYGIFNRIDYRIRLAHINYTDIRQNLIMKLFGAVAVNISCAGYGAAKNRMPVLMPVKREKDIGKGLEKMGVLSGTETEFRAQKAGAGSYLLLPVITAVSVIPVYRISIDAVTSFFPKLAELFHFAAVMAEIPLAWFIIVKIAALLTSGISFYDDSIIIRCSQWNSFHTVVGEKEKVAKVEIEQNLLQKLSRRCAVSIWFGSEEYKRFKVKAISENDGRKIAEKLGYKEIMLDNKH
ncbi:MAG: PH domain-containing protein [Ruminococcus sp.]|nr:PH domain-containing protein [Ruminococcus sp.]